MILIILGVGLILRLISLNQSLWLDEATTALVSKMPLGDIFTKFLPGDFHPPLYYLIMKGWATLFGYSEIALRMPSIAFGLGMVYLTYLIGKKLDDKKTGLLASILLATSGLSIYYSQEARMYSLAAFLVLGAVYFFLEKKWVIFSVILALVGMTDYVSLFIIPVFLIAAPKLWKKISLSLIPVILSFVVWSPIFIRQISAGMSVKGSNWWNVLGTPTFKNFALIPVKFMFGRISFDNKYIYLVIAIIASILFVYLLFKSLKTLKIVWVWLILPILIGTIVSFKIPTLSYFRFLFSLPAFYLLVSCGILKTGKHKILILCLVVLFNLGSSMYYLVNPKFHREDWRGATKFIESNKMVDSITVFPKGSNMEAYLYYSPNAKIAGPEGIQMGYSQIWLMDYLSDVFDPEGTAKSKVEALGYRQEANYTFNGVGQVNLYK